MEFIKYPKTRHIEGANGQGLKCGGRKGLFFSSTPVVALPSSLTLSCVDQHLVIEEKMDGTQVGVGFDHNVDLYLQSRGSIISNDIVAFYPFRRWAECWYEPLWDILSDRYLMFGEWLLQKHTIFYDALPDYFLEYDIYDKKENVFLDTAKRQVLLNNASFIHSVKVLSEGKFSHAMQLDDLVGKSHFISENARESLIKQSQEKHFPVDCVLKETESGNKMEGLYIKVEQEGSVVERYKYIRRDFIRHIESAKHWKRQYSIDNILLS